MKPPALLTRLRTQNAERVIQAVCDAYRLTAEELLSRRRCEPIAEARLLTYYLLDGSVTSISKIMNRDHGSVVSGRQRIRALMDVYPEFRAKVEELKAAVKSDA